MECLDVGDLSRDNWEAHPVLRGNVPVHRKCQFKYLYFCCLCSSPDPAYPHREVVAVYEVVGGEARGGDHQPGEGGRHVSAGHQVPHGQAHALHRGQVQQHVAQVGVERV